jgi:hypothetical protein
MRVRRLAAATAMALLLAGPAAAKPPAKPAKAPAKAPAKPAPEPVQPWNCLDFRAEQLMFKGKTRICAKKARAEEMREWLPASDPKEPPLPQQTPGARLMKMTVSADLSGRLSEEEVFFEPGSGRTLQRTRVKLGSDPYRKSYRFGTTSLDWTRSAPKSREETERAEPAWSKIENLSAPYPQGSTCKVYSEPILLLYLLAAHDWNSGKDLELCMFAGKKWNRVEAVSQGMRAFPARYDKNGQPSQVSEARVIVLKAGKAGSDQGEESFELMGLRGDLEILLDPQNGLPLAIQGEMPWLGQVTVRLEKAETPSG